MHRCIAAFPALLPALAVAGTLATRSSGTAGLSPAGRVVTTGSPAIGRTGHIATLLPNGRVLIAGGMVRNGVFLASAELYDPATGTFATAGSLGSVRGYGATATLLANGKVLITGGKGERSCNASAEIYDPSTNQFAPTGAMTTQRCSGVAIRLLDGKVLVAGGDITPDNEPQVSAEIYDPATGVFRATGSMRTPRDYFAGALMKDGRVLVAGGSSAGQHANTTVEASAEMFDPSTGRFSVAGEMSTPRDKLGSALLSNGTVIMVGGQAASPWGTPLSSTEIYDPASGRISAGPMMGFGRFKLPRGLVPLANGRLLIAGGAERPEVYDPASNAFFTVGGEKLSEYYFSTVTLLSNNTALIVGGRHAWLYEP
jgi:hypothetical protein